MYGRTHVAKKNSPNYTSTPQTNPFAPRSFGEDTPQQSPATKSQEELDAAYEHNKRLNSNWADIPVFPPGKEPNPPFNSQLSIQARYQQQQNSLVTSPENPIQRQCNTCDSEEKESQGQQEIQTKLTVGAAGDPYEQEADRVAAQVMSMSDTSPQVQRLEEDEKPVQMSSLAQSITPVVRRQVDEQIQMKPGETQASGDVESRLNGSKGGGSPLAPEVRAFMEPRFGTDFSGVRVHTGGEAVQMSKDLGAQAFTHGSDVYFGEGKAPGNNELTAHELTHVVQQTGGHLQPTLQRKEENFDEQKRLAQLNSELAVEIAKAAADIAGILDPTPISDGISASISIAQGDYSSAGLSLLAMIPYVGDAVGKPLKLARNSAKIVKLEKEITLLTKALIKDTSGSVKLGGKASQEIVDAGVKTVEKVVVESGSTAPKIAKAEKLLNALKNFPGKTFRFGSETFNLDKKGMEHILKRHHPKFWDGSEKASQTFFNRKMSIDDITNAIGEVLKQNRETLIKKGSQGMYPIQGKYNNVEYVLGLNKGRIGQFYPK